MVITIQMIYFTMIYFTTNENYDKITCLAYKNK